MFATLCHYTIEIYSIYVVFNICLFFFFRQKNRISVASFIPFHRKLNFICSRVYFFLRFLNRPLERIRSNVNTKLHVRIVVYALYRDKANKSRVVVERKNYTVGEEGRGKRDKKGNIILRGNEVNWRAMFLYSWHLHSLLYAALTRVSSLPPPPNMLFSPLIAARVSRCTANFLLPDLFVEIRHVPLKRFKSAKQSLRRREQFLLLKRRKIGISYVYFIRRKLKKRRSRIFNWLE